MPEIKMLAFPLLFDVQIVPGKETDAMIDSVPQSLKRKRKAARYKS